MGIINAGTAVGAVVAPPAIAAMIQYLGWRWVFFLCGAAGLLWTLWWLRDYFAPAEHPRLSAQEHAEIEEVSANPAEQKSTVSWFNLFAFPQVWGLLLGKFLIDAAWYSYLSCLPKYPYEPRGFTPKQWENSAWIPSPPPDWVVCLAAGFRANCC